MIEQLIKDIEGSVVTSREMTNEKITFIIELRKNRTLTAVLESVSYKFKKLTIQGGFARADLLGQNFTGHIKEAVLDRYNSYNAQQLEGLLDE